MDENINETQIATALMLLKVALGITHDKRDVYFRSLLSSTFAELKERGISIDVNEIEDNMLLADYAEFNYRNRDSDNKMPQNLDLRIRNRKVKGRANNGA